MLLYFFKHSRPDIANATQELSKRNDGVNSVAFCKFHHVFKYVLNIKNFGLKMEPFRNKNEPWEIVYFSNSNNDGYPVSRKSVSGFMLNVLGVPVSWQSKVHRRMMLSSSEAEYE